MSTVRKRFGQHFLNSPDVVERIISAINPKPGDSIVEIGPGRGALTLPLLHRLGRLDVVEVDKDLAAELLKQCQDAGHLNLLRQDALKTDFSAFGPARLQVVGNLPYNISTPLLFHLLRFREIGRMLFMLQKEVVDRICAQVNTSEYGRLSVMVQVRCRAKKLFEVAPDAFSPPPKVHSAVVELTVLPEAAAGIGNTDHFTELVRTAFSSRRKKISNGLKPWFNPVQLEQLGLSADARPAELRVEDYIELANYDIRNSS